MKWFRFYSDAINNPKVQSLPPELFKFWVNLLCVTSQCDGVLPSQHEIAFYLRMSQEQVGIFLNQLIDCQLIDDGADLKPHNWEERQYKSDTSAERTKKYRENKKKKSDKKCDVTVTPPDTDTDSDTETDIKDSCAELEKPSSTQDEKKSNGQCEKISRPDPEALDQTKPRDTSDDGGELSQQELSVSQSTPVQEIPLADGSTFAVSEEMVAEWKSLYPRVDVLQQLRNIRGWNLSHLKNRKTQRGINAHINSWLTREQDRASQNISQSPGKKQNHVEVAI